MNARAIESPVLILIVSIVILTGCAPTPGRSPYATATEFHRNPLRAQELTLEAADLINDDPTEAERLLREALTADLYHGPAHNNLGVLHLHAGRLYEAANEFEWARKLMPGHPDPRMNLALTLERAGRIDEALATYQSALEVYPEHMPTIQGIARLQVRYDRRDDRTREWLEKIALRGNDHVWREWAREERARSP